MVSPKVEDYLKSIYRLQDGDTPVAPSALAAAMGVKPPTVTKMLQRMADDGLVHYERYRGARVTAQGEEQALEVLRRHRLLELFLTEYLGYDWAEAHDEADVLEHHISETLEGRIATLLGFPTVDPHGEPIPTVDLEIRQSETQESLGACEQGVTAVVSEVRDSNSDVLAYLGDAGVALGTRIRVIEIAPFGMITVETRPTGGEHSIPADVAANIYVSRLDEAAASNPEQLSEMI